MSIAGGIRKLDEEDAIAWYPSDGLRVDLARKCVETVEDQADIRMIGTPHDLPGITVIIHMAPPGQRLVSDTKPPTRRALSELGEIRRRPVDPAKRLLVNAGTDQHELTTKLLHQVELALCPVKCLRTQRFRQALEITKRLKQRNFQPHGPDLLTHFAWRSVVSDEILLEYLDPVETCCSDRLEFLRQAPGYGYRCD